MNRLVIAAVLFSLTSCASYTPGGKQSAPPGQAVYHYKKSARGDCEVTITSARDVPGLEANMDKNCAVTVKAEALSGEKMQMQMMGIMGLLLQKLQ